MVSPRHVMLVPSATGHTLCDFLLDELFRIGNYTDTERLLVLAGEQGKGP